MNTLTILLEQVITDTITYIPKLVLAIVILIIGFKVQPILDKWLDNFFKKHDYDESLEKFSQSLFKLIYKITIIIFAISIAGIQTTSIVAALGAAGFAVGLALQGSMSNFASGILILVLKPIKIGEYIDISNYSGKVNKIEIFNTTLLTLDNKMIIIPNSKITSNVLTNYSRKSLRRVDLKIAVSYQSDIKQVKKILLKIINKQKNLTIVNEEKNIFIRVSQLADSAMIFSIRVWCKSSDYVELKYNLLENIKQTFDEEKIEIPYKTLTIKTNK